MTVVDAGEKRAAAMEKRENPAAVGCACDGKSRGWCTDTMQRSLRYDKAAAGEMLNTALGKYCLRARERAIASVDFPVSEVFCTRNKPIVMSEIISRSQIGIPFQIGLFCMACIITRSHRQRQLQSSSVLTGMQVAMPGSESRNSCTGELFRSTQSSKSRLFHFASYIQVQQYYNVYFYNALQRSLPHPRSCRRNCANHRTDDLARGQYFSIGDDCPRWNLHSETRSPSRSFGGKTDPSGQTGRRTDG